ncbi:phage holin family protein [Tellurirhabdus bombi]|uniref:phage holin family protein n=1 Tax=Tellurirhabdus bombi TaxID=2907205 RepID=UPI001F39F50A|nr:phage holin family protein [Tellurirhabdus bombi]
MLEKLDEIREGIFKYLEARIELFKLETRNKVEEGVVHAVHGVILGFLATITTIFLFSLLAAWLNHVLDSRYLGFLIVAGFFMVLTIIWALGKNYFSGSIRKMAYGMIKTQQEKKAQEKTDAISELREQTEASIRQSYTERSVE